MSESNLHPEQEAQKRRSTRIVQAVPLTVTGVDALGRPFQERTSTLIINCHGARYQSKHYVLKNMWVTLEVPHNEPGREARSVRGRVTWIQRPRTVRELFQIGVELEVSGNVWGIAFPPADWFPFPETGATPSLTIPAPAETPQIARQERQEEDWSTPEMPAARVAGPEPVEDNVRVLPLPAGTDPSMHLARQVARLVLEAKQNLQSSVRESASQAVAAETRPLLAALQTQLKEAAEKSVAAAVAVQVEKSQQEVLQHMQSSVRESASQAVAEEARPLLAALQSQLKDTAERSVADAVAAQIERSQQETLQRMQSSVRESASQAIAEETRPLLAAIQLQLKDTAERSVADAVAAHLEKSQHETLQRMQSSVRESASQAVTEETRPLLAALQTQLKDTAEKSVADAVAAQIERSQQETLQRMQSSVRESASQAVAEETRPMLAGLQTQLKEAAEKSVADAIAAQIARSEQESLRRVQSEREAGMAAMLERLSSELDLRLGKAREQIDSQLAEVEGTRRAAFEQQIETRVQSAIQRLEALRGSIGTNQDEIRAAVDQMRESSAKAAADELRRWQEVMDMRTADAQARLAQMDQAARKLGEQIAAATAIGEVGWRGLLEADLAAASVRWQEKMDASIETASRQTAELLARNCEVAAGQIERELQQRINVLGNSHAQVTAQAESALGTLRAAISKEAAKGEWAISQLQESAAQLEGRRGEFSAFLQSASEEWARRSEAMLDAHTAEMNRRAESAVSGIAQRMQPMLETAGRDTIEKLASELEQRFAPQIAGATDILGKLAMDRDQAEKAIAEHQQRIWQVSERGVQDTAARGKEILAQIEKDFAESARAASGRWLSELETRATETSHSTFEALYKSADWYEKKIQTQMQTALEKGLDQTASRMREKAAEMSGLFASELDHYSRSYVEHAQGQMHENAREAAERGGQQIQEAGDAAATKFTERAAQLGREQFDLYASRTKTAFEQNAALMEANAGQVRSQLEGDARGFAVEFQRVLSTHAQQTLALGKEELAIQVDQAKDALLIESQAQARQFKAALNAEGTEAIDEHKRRLENASNSWLLTTVAKLNQQSDSLINELAETTEKRLKAVCGNVFSEMGETLHQKLAGLSALFGMPAPKASPAPEVKPPEVEK